MSSVKIASIHWFPVTAHRRYRGVAYSIPAVELNKPPAIIQTHDLFEHDEGPTQPGTNKRQKLQYLVKGEEIARDLIGAWTGSTVVGVGMNPDRHPGIWLVRDKIPVIEQTKKIVGDESLTAEERMVLDASGNQVFRDATKEEALEMWEEDLAHARMADRAYAEWCWNEGNRIYRAWEHGSKEPVPREMPPLYKAAARHYGLDADWLVEAASSTSMACPHCTKVVLKTAMICPNCTQPIDIERWARWKAKMDAALLEAQTAPTIPNPPAIYPPPAGNHGIANRGQAA